MTIPNNPYRIPLALETLPVQLRGTLKPSGQGLIAGDSFLLTGDYDTEVQPLLAAAFGFSFATVAASEATTTAIAAQVTGADLSNVKLLVVNGGVWDILAGTDFEVFIANWRTILRTTEALNIATIAVQMFPATDLTDEQSAQRIAWNSELETLTRTYSHTLTLNCDTLLGQYRDPGPEGNLYDLADAYTYAEEGPG